jgi:hypothetical protein
MIGDSSDAVWGVMDVYPRTNFPDIRKKATLHSSAGSLMVRVLQIFVIQSKGLRKPSRIFPSFIVKVMALSN